MANYEALCAFDPRVAEDKLDALIAKFEKKIKDNEGEITKIEKWGVKRIPFTFSRHKGLKEANYVVIKFSGGGPAVNVLKENFRIQEEVIRHIITKAKEPKEAKEEKVQAAEESAFPAKPLEDSTVGKSQ